MWAARWAFYGKAHSPTFDFGFGPFDALAIGTGIRIDFDFGKLAASIALQLEWFSHRCLIAWCCFDLVRSSQTAPGIMVQTAWIAVEPAEWLRVD
jgi:hypothetical protein